MSDDWRERLRWPPYALAGFGQGKAQARLLLSGQAEHSVHRSPRCPPSRFSQSAFVSQLTQI
jgi:hypothetical protein